MMYHTARFSIISSVLLLISACTYTRTTPEPAASRDYETDASCMAKFIDVDMRTGQCWVNPAKKGSAVTHILNEDADELSRVSSSNEAVFSKAIEQLNALTETQAERPEVAYIVYLLYGRTYIRHIPGHAAPFELAHAPSAGKRIYAHADLHPGNGDMPPVWFIATPLIRSGIDIAVSGWQPFMFELSVGDDPGTARSVIVCGLDPMSHHNIQWRYTDPAGAQPWRIKTIPHLLPDTDAARISIDFTE